MYKIDLFIVKNTDFWATYGKTLNDGWYGSWVKY